MFTVCGICKKLFGTHNKRRQYCSSACRAIKNKLNCKRWRAKNPDYKDCARPKKNPNAGRKPEEFDIMKFFNDKDYYFDE